MTPLQMAEFPGGIAYYYNKAGYKKECDARQEVQVQASRGQAEGTDGQTARKKEVSNKSSKQSNEIMACCSRCHAGFCLSGLECRP